MVPKSEPCRGTWPVAWLSISWKVFQLELGLIRHERWYLKICAVTLGVMASIISYSPLLLKSIPKGETKGNVITEFEIAHQISTLLHLFLSQSNLIVFFARSDDGCSLGIWFTFREGLLNTRVVIVMDWCQYCGAIYGNWMSDCF